MTAADNSSATRMIFCFCDSEEVKIGLLRVRFHPTLCILRERIVNICFAYCVKSELSIHLHTVIQICFIFSIYSLHVRSSCNLEGVQILRGTTLLKVRLLPC